MGHLLTQPAAFGLNLADPTRDDHWVGAGFQRGTMAGELGVAFSQRGAQPDHPLVRLVLPSLASTDGKQ